MSMRQMSDRRLIEVRGFKWPRRPKDVTVACLLGEDAFGRWLGVARGNPWWAADGSHSGVFELSLVKVVPSGTFWTACFNPVDPVVDVDIVLPVCWIDDALEEVDLELDILRSAAATFAYGTGTSSTACGRRGRCQTMSSHRPKQRASGCGCWSSGAPNHSVRSVADGSPASWSKQESYSPSPDGPDLWMVVVLTTSHIHFENRNA